MKIERNISSDSPSARTLCGVFPITNLFDPLKNLQSIFHIPERFSRFYALDFTIPQPGQPVGS